MIKDLENPSDHGLSEFWLEICHLQCLDRLSDWVVVVWCGVVVVFAEVKDQQGLINLHCHSFAFVKITECKWTYVGQDVDFV